MSLGELLQRCGGAGIEHAAAGDDQRLAGLAKLRDRCTKFVLRRTDAARGPDALGEEDLGIIERLCLNVLTQRKRHWPALGRVGQHRHGALQRGYDLLGPRNAVEIARYRAETVIR